MSAPTSDAALLTALFDAAIDAIVVADTEGHILRVNPAAEALFGFEAEELVGQNVSVLMPQVWGDEHNTFMERYLTTGEKHIIGIGRDVIGRRKDGSEFPVHLSVGESVQNGARLFVGILHNLTARRATEQALERSERIDAIGRMTGGITHDFNNLLTIIIGNLELLEMRVTAPSEVELVHDALDAAELGASLTAQLLAFSRKSPLSPESLDPNKAVAEAMGLLGRTLSPGIKIKTNLARNAQKIITDPARLQSALMNLAINARDAMPEGGSLLIETSNARIDDKYVAQETDIEFGDYVVVSVSDTGQGMSAEAQKRAFEPFFTTKPGSEGTGLGLSTLYGFVKQSGGHVTLYSELGFGTTISMYFPVLGTHPAKAVATEAPETAFEEQSSGRTILVVEDDPAVRRLTESRLAALGYRTYSATSADEAYAMLQDGQVPDLLFTDIVMPGKLTGQELARIARSEWPDMRILLTSGYAEEMARETAPDQAGFELLRKPFRQADLASRLRKLLAR